jgi:hypothetical protein
MKSHNFLHYSGLRLAAQNVLGKNRASGQVQGALTLSAGKEKQNLTQLMIETNMLQIGH